jgi:hypothetical protein
MQKPKDSSECATDLDGKQGQRKMSDKSKSTKIERAQRLEIEQRQ